MGPEETDMKMVNEVYENKNGNRPERVLQFGSGNFLRGFVDWMIDKANNDGLFDGSIVICQSTSGNGRTRQALNEQNGTYTLVMRGGENGLPVEKADVITSVSRCISAVDDYDELLKLARSEDLQVVVSNTTEAGIVYREGDKPEDRPPVSFPAKVTRFLYERYCHFNGAADKGLLFLPVELIDNNGGELKRIVLQYADEWELGEDFKNWVLTANEIASTLVDRIVTGYPADNISYFEEKLGYRDNALVTSELFDLWVIEGDKKWADVLPIHKTDANVVWTDDVKPYKKRKVRILNGAHTSTVLLAWLAGMDIVRDFMKDETFRTFMNKVIYDEVIPTLDLPREDLENFAAAVNDRFDNPYVDHQLLAISLNSCSKFNARCLPSLLDYQEQNGKLPACMTLALAGFIKFYQGIMEDGKYIGVRLDGKKHEIVDDPAVIRLFSESWAQKAPADVAQVVLSHKEFWGGKDLTEVPGLLEAVADYLTRMEDSPVRELVEEVIR